MLYISVSVIHDNETMRQWLVKLSNVAQILTRVPKIFHENSMNKTVVMQISGVGPSLNENGKYS